MESVKVTTDKYPELRAWMVLKGMQQKELAGYLGVSEASITQYMNGTNEWPVECAVRVSLLTDVPLERLVNRKTARILKLWGKRTNSSVAGAQENAKVV